MSPLAPYDLQGMDPMRQGILSAGFAALAASGSSPVPVGLGSVFGRAGMAGLSTYNEALNSLRKHTQTEALVDQERKKTELLAEQIKKMQRELELKETFIKNLFADNAIAQPVPNPMMPGPGASIMAGSGNPMAPGNPAASVMAGSGLPFLPEQQQAPAPQPSQGPLAPEQFPMNMRQTMAAKALGVGDFTEMYKFANTPQHVPAGSFYREGATGPMQQLPDFYKDPRYLQMLEEQKAAIELRNRAPVRYDVPGIGPIMMTGDAAQEYARTGALSGQSPSEGAAPIPITTPRPRPQIARPGAVRAEAELAGERETVVSKAKREAERPDAAVKLRSSISLLNRFAETAKDLHDHPGVGRITGLMSYAKNIRGSDAANADALLLKLKAQAAFKELREMRESSPTGGALGNVTDRELDRLENALAALDPKQGTEQFKRELRAIRKSIARTKALMARGFGEVYGAEHAREFKLTDEELELAY